MGYNTIGNNFSVTSYGESHGKEIGVIIDGCPSGIELNLSKVQYELERRKPGQSDISTSRKEDDQFEILSGLMEGITTGAPILIRIPNEDQRSKDYSQIKDLYRPSHADESYDLKYAIRDYRGGGRASARITAGWVAAGAIAKQILGDIQIRAYVKQIGKIIDPTPLSEVQWNQVELNTTRAQNQNTAALFENHVLDVRAKKDSLGGVIRGAILNPEPGIGEPVFGKLHAQLAHALFSINAVKGVSFGEGFDMSEKLGSEVNDAWTESGKKSNFSGGIQGGISTGDPIYFDVVFKPTASIGQKQIMKSKEGIPTTQVIMGRHDPCVVPRAVPIVEAMTAIVYLDLWMRQGN